ncbi:MAG: hypothetical protein HY331_06350 [Chloroflexi bacterium]|nr:hypothetical protein [Chloroflexota bacterium]
MVETAPAGLPAGEFVARLARYGVLAQKRSAANRVRFVTHRLIGDTEVARAAEAAAALADGPAAGR